MHDHQDANPSIDSVLQEPFDPLPHSPPPKYMYHTAIPDSTDQDLFPVHSTQVTCCHCDNTQNLLEEWNPHTGEHRAVCNVCTWAFCLRCHIEPAMNVIVFRGGKAILPKLPSSDCRYMFIWLCSTCGRDEAIDEKKVRQRSAFTTVDLKAFRCSHCTQNATRGCIFLAMSVYWDYAEQSTLSLPPDEMQRLKEKKRSMQGSSTESLGVWSKIFKRLRKD